MIFFFQVKTWQCNVKMRNRLYQFNNTKLIKVQHGSPGHQFFSTVWPWFLFGFIFFMCGLWKIEWATLAPQPTITRGGVRSINLVGQTVIDCLFLSRKNHGGTAPLAPLALTPLIIVRFSALAIPAESAIADKKKKKERKLFSLLLKQFPKAVNFIIFKNWIEDEKNRENKVWIYYVLQCGKTKKKESTCKSQWKMDLVINYSSDIIIDNYSFFLCMWNEFAIPVVTAQWGEIFSEEAFLVWCSWINTRQLHVFFFY